MLKQRTESATFTEEDHVALVAQHTGLAADSPTIPKTSVCHKTVPSRWKAKTFH